MCRHKIAVRVIVVVALLINLLMVQQVRCEDDFEHRKSWDIVVFSQHWPITMCAEWLETKPNNKCRLPPKENLWTIHGIWPTMVHKEGPFFCNKTWPFNARELDPILPDLELYWMNVESNTPKYSLWKHEWLKHGTCAAMLPAFESELSFFRKGLEWTQKYDLHSILSKDTIEPRPTGYHAAQIFNAVKAVTGKNPQIECVVEKHSKQSLLSEIKICFDKSLTLMDCDLVKHSLILHNKILTNCDLKKPVMYLNKVPDTLAGKQDKYNIDYVAKLYRIYNFVQYLIRVTL